MITVLTTIIAVAIILVAAYLLLGTYLFLTVVPFAAILSAAIAIMNIFKAISIENEFSTNTTQLKFKDNEIKRTYGKGISWTSITTVLTLIVSFGLNEKSGLSALWSFIPFAAFCLTCVMSNLYNKRMSSKLEQAKKEDDIKTSRIKARREEEKSLKELALEKDNKEKEKQKQEAKEEKQERKEEKQRQKQEKQERRAEKRKETITAIANSSVGTAIQDGIVDDINAHFEDKREAKHLKRQLKQSDMLLNHQQKQGQMMIKDKQQQLALEDASLKVEDIASDIEFKKKASKLGVKVADKSVEEIAQQVLALSPQAAIDALPAGLDDVTKAKYILDGRV